MPNQTSRRLFAVTSMVAAVALVLGLAAPAAAGPETLKRSVENLTQWPLDIVATPIVAGKSIVTNLQSVEDSPGVRIAYPVPGYLWNVMVGWGASVLRGVTGVLELIPGVVLLFLDADMDPLFDPADENDALVDWENGIYDVKFGVDYTTPAF